jgi:uncharacterized protein
MADKLWQYIKECVQLLHWIYFQPYTFANKLHKIHPDLRPTTNPVWLRSEFIINPQLKRYSNQVLLLTSVIPLLAVSIFVPIYSQFSEAAFNFMPIGLFLLGWFVGIYIAIPLVDSWKWSHPLTQIIFILLVSSAVFSLTDYFAPFATRPIHSFFSSLHIPSQLNNLTTVMFGITSIMLSTVGGMILGLIFRMTFCVTISMSFLVSGEVLYGLTDSIAMMVAIGIALGMSLGSVRRIALGIVVSVVGGAILGMVTGVTDAVQTNIALGVTLGMKTGTAFSVSCLLSVLRIYFWLPELIWLLLLRAFVRQGKAAGALRWLPPYFDQLIHLPLPFMTDLIIEAHRTHPTSAQSTINYLISSTNQQKVAQQAMFGIALDRLNQCRYLRDIVQAKTQLAWLPNDAETFGEVLPQLLSISQSISAATNATSPYRTLELLNTPIQNLETLRSRLVRSDLRQDAPLFGSLIDRSLRILKDSRQTLNETAAQSAEIPNRYLLGNALDPTNAQGRFKGRQDLFRAIESISLSAQPPTLLLYGRRRTGKTSALKYLPQRVGGDIVPLLVDFQGASMIEKIENVAQFIAEEMIRSAQTSRDLQLPPIDAKAVTADPFDTLRTWLETIERRIPGKRFLLCFDEFERLEEVIQATGKRTPLNFFRHIMQHRPQWVLLFSGSHTLRELQPYWSDCLISTQTLKLTYLQPAEARELILSPVPDFPDIYESATVDAIIHLTRCQPYLVQLVCYCLVEQINAAQRQRVTPRDVETVVATVLERATGYFDEFWRGTLTSEQRELLTRFVSHPSAIDLDPNERDQIICKQLIQLDVLEQTSDRFYQFQIPLIQKFIESEIQMQ